MRNQLHERQERRKEQAQFVKENSKKKASREAAELILPLHCSCWGVRQAAAETLGESVENGPLYAPLLSIALHDKASCVRAAAAALLLPRRVEADAARPADGGRAAAQLRVLVAQPVHGALGARRDVLAALPLARQRDEARRSDPSYRVGD